MVEFLVWKLFYDSFFVSYLILAAKIHFKKKFKCSKCNTQYDDYYQKWNTTRIARANRCLDIEFFNAQMSLFLICQNKNNEFPSHPKPLM